MRDKNIAIMDKYLFIYIIYIEMWVAKLHNYKLLQWCDNSLIDCTSLLDSKRNNQKSPVSLNSAGYFSIQNTQEWSAAVVLRIVFLIYIDTSRQKGHKYIPKYKYTEQVKNNSFIIITNIYILKKHFWRVTKYWVDGQKELKIWTHLHKQLTFHYLFFLRSIDILSTCV